ncbi:unnamed protein product [Heterosigma akashiwo]
MLLGDLWVIISDSLWSISSTNQGKFAMGSSFVILLVLLALIGTSQIGQAGAVSATFPASPKKTKEGGNRPEVNLVAGKGYVVGGLQPVPKGQGGATAYIGQCIQGARFFVDKFCTAVVNAKQHLIAQRGDPLPSIFAMYPLDTIKTRLQAEASQVVRPAAGAGLLAQAGALYRGCPASLFGQIPYGMLTFGSYEVYKELISTSFPNVSKTFTYFISPSSGHHGLLLAGALGDRSSRACRAGGRRPGPGGHHRRHPGHLGARRVLQGVHGADRARRALPGHPADHLRDAEDAVLAPAQRPPGGCRARPPGGRGGGKLSGLEGAVLGAVAGSFSAGVTTPLDVIKTPMMMKAARWQERGFDATPGAGRERGAHGRLEGAGAAVTTWGPAWPSSS